MKVIHPSEVKGTLNAPASKSVMIRAVAASLLAQDMSRLANPSFCTDALAALGIADTLGANLEIDKEVVSIKGTGGFTTNKIKSNSIHCGESGLCMRMFAPITALTRDRFIFKGSGSLSLRPMRMLEAISLMGGTCETSKDYPPVTIQGPLRGGAITLDGSESSQFLTGLLMALPLCKEDSRIEVINLKSKPYVIMTIDLLKRFGITIDDNENLTSFSIKGNQRYEAQTYAIEGDWSGAAFLLVAGAIAGSIKVKGLRIDSFQADKAILEGLTRAGATVEAADGYILVKRKELNAFEFDAEDCPDLVPPLTALAAHCTGTSVIYGVERLKHKESNRALTLASEFSKLAVRIELFSDRMEIHGSKPAGNHVDSHNDHRIAMACAIVALDGSGPVVIEHSGSVAKSYPHFFEDLSSIKVAL
ncbi:MAG: 3-phosphoshikimate 1-carboxyvinyltransferase [Syntrophus sp. (in: bacteria)]|nr:3-phosphoshikimate 1-carboxyvinyltransferase [Syntrophus sp. (in: bacteria)]